MRLTTARDEISIQKDIRARDNAAYETLLILSRVITQLGTLAAITPDILESLFLRDLAYLREFYNRINQQGDAHIPIQCPNCKLDFQVELALSGES